jgi:hypothetical protein
MTHSRGAYRWRLATGAALLTSLATAAAFLAPGASGGLASVTVPEAAAQTLMPGTNCSASLSGTALDRSGWVASTNSNATGADVAANALDGNLATRFSTDQVQVPGLFYEVNMGSAHTFDELDMAVPNSPTDYARSYQVEVSNNGSTWTTVATCTGTGTPEIVSFPAQTAQYVLVYLTGSANYWWSIDELNLFTASTGANCYASLAGTALDRSGWVANTNAPSSSADAPANALDGNLTTRFSTDETQRPNLYFQVDMSSPQRFNELDMEVPNSPTDYARAYEVEVSNDGSNWATVATCVGTGTPQVVSFPSQTARYVRVTLTGTSDHYWWSIDEFNLYTSAPPPPPTTTTTTTPTPPTTTTTVPQHRRPCVGRGRFECCFGPGRHPMVALGCCFGPGRHPMVALGCCFGPGRHPMVALGCCFGPGLHPVRLGCCFGRRPRPGGLGRARGRFHGDVVCLSQRPVHATGREQKDGKHGQAADHEGDRDRGHHQGGDRRHSGDHKH